MNILLIICSRKITMMPWWIPSEIEDPSMRQLCRGWSCGSSKENITLNEKFNLKISKYKNNSLNSTLYKSLNKLVHSGYVPAICASGFFHLIGIGNYEINIEKSLNLLNYGASLNFWSCHEILAFHPNSTNKEFHLEKASNLGSVLAKIKIANKFITQYPYNYIEATKILKHLGTTSISSWFKKKRSGIEFSKIIKEIYLNEFENHTNNYLKLKKMALNNHLPAILWLTDGLLKNKTNIINYQEISNILLPLIQNGPWRFEPNELLFNKDKINKKNLLNYLINLNNPLIDALNSYKILL